MNLHIVSTIFAQNTEGGAKIENIIGSVKSDNDAAAIVEARRIIKEKYPDKRVVSVILCPLSQLLPGLDSKISTAAKN